MEDGIPAFVLIPASEEEDSGIGDIDNNSGISSSSSCYPDTMKRRGATATTAELRDFAAGGESCTVYSKEASSTQSTVPLIILHSNGCLYNDETREPCNDYNPQQGRGNFYYEDDDFSFSTISTKETQFSYYCEICFAVDENEEEVENEERDDSALLSQVTPLPEFFYTPPPLDFAFTVGSSSNDNNIDKFFTEGFVNVGRLPGVY
eukprot:scaffold24070_cov92-Amphora_coffeaeformis.AAC.1